MMGPGPGWQSDPWGVRQQALAGAAGQLGAGLGRRGTIGPPIPDGEGKGCWGDSTTSGGGVLYRRDVGGKKLRPYWGRCVPCGEERMAPGRRGVFEGWRRGFAAANARLPVSRLCLMRGAAFQRLVPCDSLGARPVGDKGCSPAPKPATDWQGSGLRGGRAGADKRRGAARGQWEPGVSAELLAQP